MLFRKKNAKTKALTKAICAEFVGTFLLALFVSASLLLPMGIPTPVIAGLTLAFIVHTIGTISGAHVNPAVTLALFSIDKIDSAKTFKYILAQLSGGLLALLVVHFGFGMPIATPDIFAFNWLIVSGEILGTAILGFAIAAVVLQKTDDNIAGLTIGGGLLLGAVFAAPLSTGVLNPAVAVAVGSISLIYLVAPIVGACIGMWIYRSLV